MNGEMVIALIKCPECGRENVSSTAFACSGCGLFKILSFKKYDQQVTNDIDIDGLHQKWLKYKNQDENLIQI